MLLTAFPVITAGPASAQSDPCGPGSNPVECENSKPGTPSSEWDINQIGDESIQGFATEMSVDVGESVGFKIDTDATDYEVRIYRLGWYGGDGARLVDTISSGAVVPQDQPSCLYESETGLTDCGNWGVSATWDVPTDAVSGVYIARPVRTDTGGDSHIVFVVRDDASTSDVVFQTSDSTWQAYNAYGGNSLYHGEPWNRALKVSYNRPFTVRQDTPDGRDSVFGSEYAMIRWLERNGYDVSYVSGIDTDRTGSTFLTNHEVFLSVGHDEYWSGAQRTNVEAARDAGVNLAFLSGNEVYWKTRWEPSIDGSATPYRTLVTYKETLEDAKVDPSSEWTGTWRDPRFSPPSDGGRPENSLTGTLFTVNCCTYALKVPAEYSGLRFWRDTAVEDLAPGSELELPWGTLGYEWDEDVENGFRPAGAFRMSSTTELVPQKLIDFGSEVAELDATHHLMMYRASSGALVFGAGTVQWSWGLDDYHDGPATDTSTVMQQATVNVLADMGVQPNTLQPVLVAASASTDVTAPTATITAPAPGTQIGHGDVIEVAGTAADVGGVVAGVEVSLDGGSTWRRADGTGQWSFATSSNVVGSQQIMARAVDDSANLGSAVAVAIDVGCPCTIFSDDAVPAVASFDDTSSLELGVKFQADADGWIEGVRFFKGPLNTGTHTGSLWTADGTLLARAQFTNETPTGWQEVSFGAAVPVTAGTTYVASYHAPHGGYSGDTGWFDLGGTSSPPLRALEDGEDGANGLFTSTSVPEFPVSSFGASNYWVDVVYTDVEPIDTRAPQVLGSAPVHGSSSVPLSTSLSVEFDEAVDPASVTFLLEETGSATLAGTITVDGSGTVVTFDPVDPMTAGTAHVATVTAADAAGNQVADPFSFSFTTAAAAGSVAALWDDAVVPATPAVTDPLAVTVGVRFTADEDVMISGVRFFKGEGNNGRHVGSLWAADGTLLAEAEFVAESAAGWQQVAFISPVAITAGVSYVASYYAPQGHYAADSGYFSSAHTSGPLSAPAATSEAGNGLYGYGAEPRFPTATWGATNYWVTPVYKLPPDETPPALESTTPVNGASSIAWDTEVSATFDEPVDPASVTMVVSDGDGPVVGETTYVSASRSVAFTPADPLEPGTTYTVEIDATDVLGNPTVHPLGFSFVTALPEGAVAAIWDETVVPATVSSGDVSSVTLGVRFQATEAIEITGVRFYKGFTNTGVHVGSLWDGTGSLMTEATFSGETSSGWQEVVFESAVLITPGQVYTASYHAPNGRYAVDSGYFGALPFTAGPLLVLGAAGAGNGVYSYGSTPGFPDSSWASSNYWVSPVYRIPEDETPPGLVGSTPVDGATSVPSDTVISASFDEPVDPASVAIAVSEVGGGAIAGSVSFDAETETVSFLPDAPLESATTYVVEVAAADAEGNATAAPLTVTFTTASTAPTAALWNDAAQPTVLASGDTGAIEVGVKFIAESDGSVTGVRFYKGPGNVGTHTGSLWSSTGELLGRVTFTAETAAGWQQATFSSPVVIDAGTTYVASYHAPSGRYSVDPGYFGSTHVNGPLSAPSSASAGGNGVYAYTSGPAYPSSSFGESNYWVSPVFQSAPDTQSPQLVGTSPADGGTSVPTGALLEMTFDESIDPDSIVVDVVTAATAVDGTVSYDDASRTVTFEPVEDLVPATQYDVSFGVSDTAGNPLAGQSSFSFSTATAAATAALWGDETVPDNPSTNDAGAVNLGVAFTTSESVDITGIRFYKGAGNTGNHVGSLWDGNGDLLAQVTFSGESATGWQEATFPVPVPIEPGTAYIASYFAPNGHYAADAGYFSSDFTVGPLTALASAGSVDNGLYVYGSTPQRPVSSWQSTNYWVSPVYADEGS